MTLDDLLARVRAVAEQHILPNAAQNDREGRFNQEVVDGLGKAGLMGLTVPKALGGLGLGPREFSAVTRELAQYDASAAMVYVMHVAGTNVLVAAPQNPVIESTLRKIAAGQHLTTLAFSERGSRSHFWAPVSRAQLDGKTVVLNCEKSWVTSANHADSYVTTTLSAAGAGPTDSTLYLVPRTAAGVHMGPAFDGLGLRGNDSAAVSLKGVRLRDEDRLTEEGAGFKCKLEVVLPFFNLGSASMNLGICQAALAGAVKHLKTARFEHMGVTLAEALPNLRAHVAEMQTMTDTLQAFLSNVIDHLERRGDLTVLRVLECKALASETSAAVTSLAMRCCGGAAFSRQGSVERCFRDAQASTVMAPTTDVLREFIGKAVLGMPLF